MNKDYNLLQLLVVLYQTRQTVATAKKLNISQPTVSIMLKKLREQFNDELFVRNKNRLEPTAKCVELVDKIPTLLEQLDSLYLESKEWDVSQMQGEITLLFPPAFMAPIAAPLINTLTHAAPNLTVVCNHWGSDAITNLEESKSSWGVSYLPMETNKNIIQRDLVDDKFNLVLREEHPLIGNQLDQILEYPICISVIPGYIEPSKAEMLIKKYKLEKTINVRTSDIGLMLKLVKESNYIGVISEQYQSELGKDYRWEALPSELYKDTFRRQLALFCHLRHRNSPFTHWLHQQVNELLTHGTNRN